MVIVTNFLFIVKTKSYNGFTTDCFEFLPILDHFDDKFGGEDKTIESQSSGGAF
jgi:hypothetical protein